MIIIPRNKMYLLSMAQGNDTNDEEPIESSDFWFIFSRNN